MPEACAGPATCRRSTTGRRCLRRHPASRAGGRAQDPLLHLGRGVHLPRHRHRRLGGGDHQHAVARRHGAGRAQRHVLAPLDRHVPAPRPGRRDRRCALGRGRARRPLRGDPDAPTPATEIKAVLATHNETATGVLSDIAAVRRGHGRRRHPALLFVDGVSSIGSMDVPSSTTGASTSPSPARRRASCCRRPGHRRLQPQGAGRDGNRRLPRTFFDIRDMARTNAKGGYPYTPPLSA
jgi:hypothetical protein